MRERVLVQDRDLVARGQHRARHRGPDAAGADDEYEGIGPDSTEQRRRRSAWRHRARRRASAATSGAIAAGASEAGGAVRITWHGALDSTYSGRLPTKSSSGPPRPPSSAPPRIFDGSSAASTIGLARRGAWPRRRSPARRGARATVAVATSTPSYSSPTALARAQRRARLLELRLGQRARRSAATSAPRRSTAPRSSRPCPSSKASSSSSPASRPGGLDDVVVQRRARRAARGSTRTRPRGASPRSARLGDEHARRTDLPCVVR